VPPARVAVRLPDPLSYLTTLVIILVAGAIFDIGGGQQLVEG
jgi:hypothetical protein